MSATVYEPAGTLTAGNLRVALLQTQLADLKAVPVETAKMGVVIQCALENFGTSTEVNTSSRRKLCDREQRTKIASRTRSINDMVIVGDKADKSKILTILQEDAKIAIVARPYVSHETEFAQDDEVWTFNATVSSVDPAEITTGDAEEFSYLVKFADVKRALDAKITA